jgi:hypothetical protein
MFLRQTEEYPLRKVNLIKVTEFNLLIVKNHLSLV